MLMLRQDLSSCLFQDCSLHFSVWFFFFFKVRNDSVIFSTVPTLIIEALSLKFLSHGLLIIHWFVNSSCQLLYVASFVFFFFFFLCSFCFYRYVCRKTQKSSKFPSLPKLIRETLVNRQTQGFWLFVFEVKVLMASVSYTN